MGKNQAFVKRKTVFGRFFFPKSFAADKLKKTIFTVPDFEHQYSGKS
jgi:hypothetical protein